MNDVLEKIDQYNANIQEGLKALNEMAKEKNITDEVGILEVISKNPSMWKNECRPIIASVMAHLNAQAKLVQGLAFIVKYNCSNLRKNNTLLLDYSKIIDLPSAKLLYSLERFNFCFVMGKSLEDWFKGGEGLFFSLYFDSSHPMFDVGVAPRPIPLLDEKLIQSRQKERDEKFNEMYPPIAVDRPNTREELNAFLLAVEAVSAKDAAYKTEPQKAWSTITSWIKEHVPNAKDVDTVPASKMFEIVDNERNALIEDAFKTLVFFFVHAFDDARSCTALRLDLLNDKRLPSITRIVALYALNVWYGEGRIAFNVPEWVVTMAYGSPMSMTSPLLTEVRDLLVTAPQPMRLYR